MSTRTQLVSDGAWCWFQEPRAIRYVGGRDRTYMGWTDNLKKIWVGAFDHADGSFESHMMHDFSGTPNDHDNPTLRFLSDGRLQVFWCVHNGTTMYNQIATVAESITSWGTKRSSTLSTQYTYPSPATIGNTLVLHWRRGTDGGGARDPVFRESSDDGVTWGIERALFHTEGGRPYVKIIQIGGTRIDYVITDSHPNEVPPGQNNIYHFYRDGNNFYRSDGALIGGLSALPLDSSDLTRVYNGAVTGTSAWMHDLTLDSNGRPVFVFARFVTVDDHRYHYARWTGSAWQVTEFCSAGSYFASTASGEFYYSGGIGLDHVNASVVYASRQVTTDGPYEMYRYTTANGGASFTSEQLTSGSNATTGKNLRPLVPRNRSPELPVLWMYGSYKHWLGDFHTALVYLQGDSVPTPEPAVIVYDVEYRAGTSGAFTPLTPSLSGTSFNWNTAALPATAHQVRVQARDTSDASAPSGWSAIRTINVSHGVVPPDPNVPPACTMTAPANGTTITAGVAVALAATASDSDGTVTGVSFYRGTSTLIGAGVLSGGVWTRTWTPGEGSYSIFARATDNDAATGDSSAVTLIVQTAGTPTPAFTLEGTAYDVLADGMVELEPEVAGGVFERAFDGTLLSTSNGELRGWRVPLDELSPSAEATLRTTVANGRRVTVGGWLLGITVLVTASVESVPYERDGIGHLRVPALLLRAVAPT